MSSSSLITGHGYMLVKNSPRLSWGGQPNGAPMRTSGVRATAIRGRWPG
ncbi:MAG: hypothetical protein K0S88_6012, partial [Actinomycetia bacterium]|nr:hypothetical protein [Actinomycetes bacterium]